MVLAKMLLKFKKETKTAIIIQVLLIIFYFLFKYKKFYFLMADRKI